MVVFDFHHAGQEYRVVMDVSCAAENLTQAYRAWQEGCELLYKSYERKLNYKNNENFEKDSLSRDPHRLRTASTPTRVDPPPLCTDLRCVHRTSRGWVRRPSATSEWNATHSSTTSCTRTGRRTAHVALKRLRSATSSPGAATPQPHAPASLQRTWGS